MKKVRVLLLSLLLITFSPALVAAADQSTGTTGAGLECTHGALRIYHNCLASPHGGVGSCTLLLLLYYQICREVTPDSAPGSV